MKPKLGCSREGARNYKMVEKFWKICLWWSFLWSSLNLSDSMFFFKGWIHSDTLKYERFPWENYLTEYFSIIIVPLGCKYTSALVNIVECKRKGKILSGKIYFRSWTACRCTLQIKLCNAVINFYWITPNFYKQSVNIFEIISR